MPYLINQKRLNLLVQLIIVSLLFSSFHRATTDVFVIRNINVIPMNKDTVLKEHSLLIKKGRIIQISPNNITPPANAALIDGSGKYMIPGLMDMHAHFFYEQGEHVNTCEAELKMMLANGLTTARIQCGDSVYLHARKMVTQQNWIGPTLFVSSPQIVGNWPWKGKVFAAICTTPKEAELTVKQFKKAGYDEIKITFMVKADVYDAIIKTAKKLGIKVTGHVGPLVGLQKALDAKQQIEHLDEFIEVLLPDTSFNHGMSVSDMGIWKKNNWETVEHLDELRIPLLVNKVKQSGISVTATNHFFISCFGEGVIEEVIKKGTSYQYIPPVIKEERWHVRDLYLKRGFPETSRKKYIQLRNNMVYELWKAGVPLMAGSDSPEWFLVQGFALHDELAQFVKSGLTPFAALQTATINPATYLGIINYTGTIEAGKQADLVILNQNPLTDITHTKNIYAVVKEGKYFSFERVKQLLDEAKKELNK